MAINKNHIKKILFTLTWSVVAVLCVWLLVAAVGRQQGDVCKEVVINVNGNGSNFFIDKKDVLQIINAQNGGTTVGKKLATINLHQLETELRKDTWVKEVQIYFDNNRKLNVSLEERMPVARIFTTEQNSFYIDSSLNLLPLSAKFSARLPVFTNFPGEKNGLSKADSNLLKQIKTLSSAIATDDYIMAMIDQVDINASRQFEMIPKIGNQVILFGDAENVKQKFDKLKVFYRGVITKVGWSKYSSINLQYKNQVVAVIRGKEEIKADSLRALALLEEIAQKAEAEALQENSKILPEVKETQTDQSIIQQSIEREEEPQLPALTTSPEPAVIIPQQNSTAPVALPKVITPVMEKPKVVTKPVVAAPVKKPEKPKEKPAPKPKPKPAASTEPRVPKAVMN